MGNSTHSLQTRTLNKQNRERACGFVRCPHFCGESTLSRTPRMSQARHCGAWHFGAQFNQSIKATAAGLNLPTVLLVLVPNTKANLDFLYSNIQSRWADII